ncbi:hypothetical protein F183_A29030 [Bryobacterales bacterium F-183]|nr:hypothetical protein F183_A29030 [Bryobacterales bacterium F-183]
MLPAGTYVFKIMDSQANRHIVQIFSEDEKTIYATILAVPNYRLKATDKTSITFHERPAGEPEALRAWFYPGRNWGEEFVYPRENAIALAKSNKLPVLFTPADVPVEVAEPLESSMDALLEKLRRAPVLAIQPTGAEVQLAQVVTTPPADELQAATAPAEPAASMPAELPATASEVPILLLTGFALVAFAVWSRFFRNRSTDIRVH